MAMRAGFMGSSDDQSSVGNERLTKPDDAAMKPAGMHRRYQFVSCIAVGDTEKEGPAGQRGSLFKGPDAAGRPAGFIPPGEGWRASPCRVRLVSRSTRYAATRLPCLARPAPLARRRGVWLRPLNRSSTLPKRLPTNPDRELKGLWPLPDFRDEVNRATGLRARWRPRRFRRCGPGSTPPGSGRRPCRRPGGWARTWPPP
jgi:hypothetical protein